MQPKQVTERAAWNVALRTLPYAHILQTWDWGDFKQRETGWQPDRLLFGAGEVQAAARSSPGVSGRCA